MEVYIYLKIITFPTIQQHESSALTVVLIIENKPATVHRDECKIPDKTNVASDAHNKIF